MKLITLEEPDKSWDEFVSKHSNLIFHTSLWGKVLKEGYGCKLRYLVLEDNDDWLLAIPGMLTGRFLKLWYSLIPYGGFIGKKEFIPKFLELLIKDIRKYKIDRLQIVDPYIKSRAELPEFKATQSVRHVLDLGDKTEDELWKSYKPTLRKTLRNALNKREASFRRIKDRKEVDRFYELYLSTMQRKKAPVRYPIKLVYKIFDWMIPESADLFFIEYQNNLIGGLLVIYSLETCHCFLMGSKREYLNLNPNALIFHNAIKVAKEREKSYFDFLGTDKRLSSLIWFKDKWGAERKHLFSLHKDINRIKVLIHKLSIPLLRVKQKL